MSNRISPPQEGYVEEDLGAQAPFPQEWMDPQDPTDTTVGSLHYHVEAYLHDDTENQLADAPYDLHNDWKWVQDDTVDKELLRFLCTNDGSGLAISPTGAYLFIARGYVTDAIELYEYISSLPATGAEAERLGIQLVKDFGPQMCYAHAHELARIVTLCNYIVDYEHNEQLKISTKVADEVSTGTVLFFTNFSWKTMRRQYRGHLRQVTNDIRNAALQASSSQVKEWNNLSSTMQRLVQQGTPRGRAQRQSSQPANRSVSTSYYATLTTIHGNIQVNT